MTDSFHRGLSFFVAGLVLMTSTAVAQESKPALNAAEKTRLLRDGAGIVWFIGTVQIIGGEDTIIDLGEAHSVADGDLVAIFRPTDRYFRPLGVVKIEESFGTWSLPLKPTSFELQPGDRAIFIRRLTDLGTGDAFRERFLRQSLVKTGERNSYGSVLKQREAEVLQHYVSRQPRWARDHKHISGTIRSGSLSRTDIDGMDPLLRQVLSFQKLQEAGINVEAAIGPQWQSALKVLTPDLSDIQMSSAAAEKQASETNADQQDAQSQNGDADAAGTAKIESFRRNIDKRLFARNQEERNAAMMMCLALDKLEPRNERQWISLQMRGTQFDALAEDETFLEDITIIMRRVREEASQG